MESSFTGPERTGRFKASRVISGSNMKRRVIVVLESAPIEVGKVKDEYVLLNCDDHKDFLEKHGKDPNHYRPDILHQTLLTLLDSPLNKSGQLQVFIHTTKNVLIDVSASTRIPRTFKRFCGLMLQLLLKLKVKAAGSSDILLSVIKNPVTDHLPPGVKKISLEVDAPLTDLRSFIPTLPENKPVCYIVGAFSHGNLKVDYADQGACISQYPLSASVCCSRLMSMYENMWDVI